MFFRRYLEAWGAHDLPGVLGCLHEDIDFRDMTLGHGAVGIQRMGRFVQSAFETFPEAHFEFVQSTDDGASFVMEWVMNPGGVKGCSVGTLRDGRIVRQRDFWSR